jgi:hypothetical protein
VAAKSNALIITKANAEEGLMMLLGISRIAVRGFFLSNSLSAYRLNPMAAFLAKKTHRTTSRRILKLRSVSFVFTARENPMMAKGSEKIVWLILTNEKYFVTFDLFWCPMLKQLLRKIS